MIDAYEQIHGPVDDRTIFDGEIIVPPHLRNMSLVNLRPNRLHSGLLGNLSRSRTFLTLSTNSQHTFHGSVPDLSHSASSNGTMPPPPKLQQQLQLSASSDGDSSTLLLNLHSNSTQSLGDFQNIHKPLSASNGNHFNADFYAMNSGTNENTLPRVNRSMKSLNNIELRRRSEDHSMYMRSHDRRANSLKPLKPIVYTTKPSDFRSESSQSMNAYTDSYITLIKTNIQSRSNSYLNRSTNRSPVRTISPLCTAASMHNINSMDSSSNQSIASPPLSPLGTCHTFQRPPKYFSSGFSGELSLSNLSKFTIPRVSLSHLSVTNTSTSSSSGSSTPISSFASTFKQFN